jgi:hypothetical protein
MFWLELIANVGLALGTVAFVAQSIRVRSVDPLGCLALAGVAFLWLLYMRLDAFLEHIELQADEKPGD